MLSQPPIDALSTNRIHHQRRMNGIRGAKSHAWRRSICLLWHPLFSVIRGKAREIPNSLLLLMEGRTTMGISKTGSGVYLKSLFKFAFGCTKYAEHIWRRSFFSWGYSGVEHGKHSLSLDTPWTILGQPRGTPVRVSLGLFWSDLFTLWPVAHQLDVVPITTFCSKKS